MLTSEFSLYDLEKRKIAQDQGKYDKITFEMDFPSNDENYDKMHQKISLQKKFVKYCNFFATFIVRIVLREFETWTGSVLENCLPIPYLYNISIKLHLK